VVRRNVLLMHSTVLLLQKQYRGYAARKNVAAMNSILKNPEDSNIFEAHNRCLSLNEPSETERAEKTDDCSCVIL